MRYLAIALSLISFGSADFSMASIPGSVQTLPNICSNREIIDTLSVSEEVKFSGGLLWFSVGDCFPLPFVTH